MGELNLLLLVFYTAIFPQLYCHSQSCSIIQIYNLAP